MAEDGEGEEGEERRPIDLQLALPQVKRRRQIEILSRIVCQITPKYVFSLLECILYC